MLSVDNRHILRVTYEKSTFGEWAVARLTNELGVEYGCEFGAVNPLTDSDKSTIFGIAADQLWPMSFSERKFSD